MNGGRTMDDDFSQTINDVTTLRRFGSVAVIAVNSPPVNALSAAVRSGIGVALGHAIDDNAVRKIVLVCEGRTFFAGADIREIGKPMAEPNLRQLQAQIEQSPKPVIAAMHGTVLGGGLELAMAAHFRIALSSTKLGLPEVKLGLMPGAGGTQRLPRLIGVLPAIEMMTGGVPILAPEAKALGLIDMVFDHGEPEEQAVAFAANLGMVEPADRRTRNRPVAGPSGDDPEVQNAIAALRLKHQGSQAEESIIASVENTLRLPFEEGLAAEAALFETLKASPQSKALREAFFARKAAAKNG